MKTITNSEPPKDQHILMTFKSGIICSGKYRKGLTGEPQPSELAWRCDCCGRFANPIKWEILEGKEPT